MNKRIILAIMAAAFAPAIAFAAPIETVKITGPFGANEWPDIDEAIASVDNGGVINIIEAGTYLPSGGTPTTTAISLTGGKSYSIIATVPGVIAGGSTYAAPWQLSSLGGPTGGNVNVTLQGFRIERASGNGPAFDVDQAATAGFTTTIVFNSMEVIHSLTASGGEALKLDDGVVGGNGAAISISGTNSTFTSANASGTAKSALRVQSDLGPIENITLNFSGCTFSNASADGCIRTDGQNAQLWTFTDCAITSALANGFRTATNGHSNCTFTFKGCTISAATECITHSVGAITCANNLWDIERCSVDNSAGTSRTIRVNYPTGSSSNELRVHNSAIKTSAASGRAIDGAFINTGTYHNNTIVGIGGTVTSSIGISMASSTAYNFSNNLFINIFDPVSGTTGTKTGNVIYGPADDGSAGAGHTYVVEPAGESNSYTALGLNASTLKQSLASALNNVGDASILATIGSVDRQNVPRPQGGVNPDVGAYEVNEITSVNDWLMLQ